jgi:hypothetical protein
VQGFEGATIKDLCLSLIRKHDIREILSELGENTLIDMSEKLSTRGQWKSYHPHILDTYAPGSRNYSSSSSSSPRVRNGMRFATADDARLCDKAKNCFLFDASQVIELGFLIADSWDSIAERINRSFPQWDQVGWNCPCLTIGFNLLVAINPVRYRSNHNSFSMKQIMHLIWDYYQHPLSEEEMKLLQRQHPIPVEDSSGAKVDPKNKTILRLLKVDIFQETPWVLNIHMEESSKLPGPFLTFDLQ